MHSGSSSSPSTTLRSLLPEADYCGENVAVAGCTDDPRRVRTGDLFFASARSANELRNALSQALARGCSAVVTDLPITDLPVPVCRVSNVRRAYGEACHARWGHPAKKLRVIGVAGKAGKTTTACLIARILAESGHSVGMFSSLGYFDGEESLPATTSTPKPPELARKLAQMRGHGCTHVVLEVSDAAIAREGLAGMELDALCLTNTSALIENKKPSRSGRCKPLAAVDNLADDGFLVVNNDDPVLRRALAHIDKAALSVGIDAPAEITGTEVERHLGEETFLLTAGWETFPVRTRLMGRHHIHNCLAAAAVGLVYGIPMETVVRGLEQVDTVPGRMQPVTCGQPFAVFIDAADTPQSLTRAIDTVRAATEKRLICVFTPGGLRSRADAWAKALASVDVPVLTTGSPRDDFDRLCGVVVPGMTDPKSLRRIADRAEAIAWALNEADEGDTVLIAGRGHKPWRPTGDHRPLIDDYQFARQWLYQEVDLRWPLT
ncbi:UDP-N-acetylmuramoyl-L-alanyl-D-glutamate--2,6-diaminopimelate ligase [Thermostilla marina]